MKVLSSHVLAFVVLLSIHVEKWNGNTSLPEIKESQQVHTEILNDRVKKKHILLNGADQSLQTNVPERFEEYDYIDCSSPLLLESCIYSKKAGYLDFRVVH